MITENFLDNQEKTYYELNKEHIKQRVLDYYYDNKDKIKEYRNENRDKINAQKRKYAEIAREKKALEKIESEKNFIGPKYPPDFKICSYCNALKHDSEYNASRGKVKKEGSKRAFCKSCESQENKQYRKEHGDNLREKERQKYKDNPEFFKKKRHDFRQSPGYKAQQKLPENRLLKNYSIYIQRTLSSEDLAKNEKSTLKYAGCERNFFLNYIESQFIDGMSWANYGNKIDQWSLDHYIPIEAFDISKSEEQNVAFGWKNCQPMWHKENEIKQDTMPDGSKARDSKNKFSLQDKIDMIENKFLSLNLVKTNLDENFNIFIKRNEWLNFSPEQMEQFEIKIFNYYRNKGFPYFNLSKQERNNIFNKLVNFNSSNILKENNILSQDVLALNLANYYMPHIFEARNRDFLTPLEVFQDDNKFKLAIKKRIELGDNMSDAGMRRVLSICSGACRVSNFKPTIAKYIYDNYSGDGNVLDFSAGFGGRLLGALSSNKIKTYNAFEPNSTTFDNLCNISQDFNTRATNIQKLPFEDSNCQHNFYDLIFSSPPYFNTEIYSDESTQSSDRYKTQEEWREKFLTPLITKSHNYLKSGGYFIINVANVKNYQNLEQDTMDLSLKFEFLHIKTYQMVLSALMKSGLKYEPIFVFQK
jgi:hypothetical protein